MAGTGEHHPGAVIAHETYGTLYGPGGVDNPVRLDPVVFHARGVGGSIGLGEVVVAALQRAVGAAVVDPEHGGARQHPAAGRLDLGNQMVDIGRARLPVEALPLPQRSTADAVALVADQHRLPGACQRQRGGQPGDPAADHQRVGEGVDLVVVVRIGLHRGAPQTGCAPDDRLIEAVPGLQPAEEKGLVVEPGRQEAADEVVGLHHVEPQRADVVLREGFEAFVQFNHRCAVVGVALGLALVGLDQRAGLFWPGRENPARAMVFKRAAEQLDPAGKQGRGEAVALVALINAAVEGEGQRPVAVDQAAFAQAQRLGQARGHWPSSAVSAAEDFASLAGLSVFQKSAAMVAPVTSWVRVWRWTTIHDRHPSA